METGLRVLLLTAALAVFSGLTGCATMRGWLDRDDRREQTEEQVAEAEEAADETTTAPPRVIEPNVERRPIHVARIDTENVEVGAFFGSLSIEDFGTNPVYGVM